MNVRFLGIAEVADWRLAKTVQRLSSAVVISKRRGRVTVKNSSRRLSTTIPRLPARSVDVSPAECRASLVFSDESVTYSQV
jgi:hypothetical protein